MTDRHSEIKSSYKQLGGMGSVYDGIITRSTLLGKLMDSLIWGLDKDAAARWINDALAPIPEDFTGSLLEVPVGTGVLTMPLYKSLPEAKITCLDYSPDMMDNAKKRAGAMGIEKITFVQGDVDALRIKSVATAVKDSVVAVPVALTKEGADAVWNALKGARKPRLQVVTPTSTVQMEYLCHKKPPVVLEMIGTLVQKAKRLCPDVEFVAQDASRSEPEFLETAIQKAIDAGATMVTVSDDAGIMTAEEFSAFIGELQKGVPALQVIRFLDNGWACIHCH